MDHQQVVTTFLDFFTQRGHHPVRSSSLITPPGDPVLFTTSGMHPLTPYLSGSTHPAGNRLTGVQRSLRTTDLEEVGDAIHLTLFEMLGSWSLGDYPAGQSLRWGFELITGGFGLEPGRLHATVFGGDEQAGPDTGLAETWSGLGVPVELTGADNWWSGPTGLCGTDSELFAWTGSGRPQGTPSSDPRWVELWNHVMLRYQRLPDGTLVPLPRPCVDTGMGLERLLMVLQGTSSVYETSLLRRWAGPVSQLWPGLDRAALRLVTDHLRASVVVLGEGVRPSSTGRGYVLRRLIRRALTALWREDPGRTLGDLPAGLVTGTLRHFGLDGPQDGVPGSPGVPGSRQPGLGGGQPGLGGGQPGLEEIRVALLAEERRFRDLLGRGRAVLARLGLSGPLTEVELRYLHETHGLPPEFATDMLPAG
jgi:alanyl-tRNA synthetase